MFPGWRQSSGGGACADTDCPSRWSFPPSFSVSDGSKPSSCRALMSVGTLALRSCPRRGWRSSSILATSWSPGGGGTCQNLDRDARPIFLGLKFGQILFFWVGKFFSYFSGFHKISAIFLGLTKDLASKLLWPMEPPCGLICF